MTPSLASSPVEPSSATRAWRALAVLLTWGVGALPAAIGQRCAIAHLTHYPCPGCGLSRAAMLLRDGDVLGSLRMHPLLVPLVLCHGALVMATVHATWAWGTPWDVWRTKTGRTVVRLIAAAYAAMLILWLLRAAGLFGGPVPVN